MSHSVGSLAIVLAVFNVASAADPVLDPALAAQYFAEAKRLASQDGGKLWGVSLEGPLLFADRQTRRVVASHADRANQLKEENGVFVGQLPPSINVANNALRWAGEHWTMVVWPLPKDRDTRAVLMMHESWHRIQDQLGLPATGPANHHLDTAAGRLWMQLEWRALRDALMREGEVRRQAIENALHFRAYRRSLFEKATAEERALETHEGLAEYTGVKLAGMAAADQLLYVARVLERRPTETPSFVRAFAYLSGPAYGLLLDATGKEWRKGLKPGDDLGELLAKALGITHPTASKVEAESRSRPYDGDRLRQAEETRERVQQERVAKHRATFVDGPVLILPLTKAQFAFDPNAAHPLPGEGTVYATLRLTDAWGVLTANNGALIGTDFQKASVPAPKDLKARPLRGEGWELELKEGWEIVAGKRAGNYVLVRK